MQEIVTRRIDTTTAFVRRDVSSTKCNRVYFVRVFSGGEFVKSVINFGVGRHGGHDAFEVFPVGTVTGVVTTLIADMLGNRGSNSMYENMQKKKSNLEKRIVVVPDDQSVIGKIFI
ncbi:hypothetical protein SLA2020_428140 [Shorea laevis]